MSETTDEHINAILHKIKVEMIEDYNEKFCKTPNFKNIPVFTGNGQIQLNKNPAETEQGNSINHNNTKPEIKVELDENGDPVKTEDDPIVSSRTRLVFEEMNDLINLGIDRYKKKELETEKIDTIKITIQEEKPINCIPKANTVPLQPLPAKCAAKAKKSKCDKNCNKRKKYIIIKRKDEVTDSTAKNKEKVPKNVKLQSGIVKPLKTYSNNKKSIVNDNCDEHFDTEDRIRQSVVGDSSKSVLPLKERFIFETDTIIKANNSKLNDSSETIKKATLKSNVKRFACEMCPYHTNTKAHFNAHLRVHSDIKPYSCHICDYKCKVKQNLQYHLRTHTGERPHICDICNLKFAQKCGLDRHLRSHTNEKPYICDICNNKYKQKGHLIRHILGTHSGKRPFVCRICDFKFTRKCHLKRHSKTHRSENGNKKRVKRTRAKSRAKKGT